MQTESFVTEWGMPGLRWFDRIGTMKGNPFTDNMPEIVHAPVERRLWITYNGVQVCALNSDGPGVVGHWHEWTSLVVGSTREDLTPADISNLERRRLRWVEHQKLTAYFSDGTINTVARSACSIHEMQTLHGEIHRHFILSRPGNPLDYAASGRALTGCEVPSPGINDLVQSEVPKGDWNVSPSSSISVDDSTAMPIMEWYEPIATVEKKGLFGKEEQNHRAYRVLMVISGDGPSRRWLSYATYRRDGKIIEVNLPLNLLTGFRLHPAGSALPPAAYHPSGTLLPGHIITAEFRYGHAVPLTCGRCDVSKFEKLRSLLEARFLPLAGKRLSDADLNGKQAQPSILTATTPTTIGGTLGGTWNASVQGTVAQPTSSKQKAGDEGDLPSNF